MRIHNLEEIQKFADDFASTLEPRGNGATIVALQGDLGAGKTTFTQCVAKHFDIADAVQSPTFVIMKIYKLKSNAYKLLIHIDAYRLEKSSELLHLGWEELISDPKNLILIEWPERVEDILPKHATVKFSHVSETEREAEVL